MMAGGEELEELGHELEEFARPDAGAAAAAGGGGQGSQAREMGREREAEGREVRERR